MVLLLERPLRRRHRSLMDEQFPFLAQRTREKWGTHCWVCGLGELNHGFVGRY